MNLEHVDQIAKAVLYEGYMLYPYRPSSVKNRQRFNFGVLYPRSYSEAQGASERSAMHIECLVSGGAGALLEVKLRFLQLQTRTRQQSQGTAPDEWEEVVERTITAAACSVDELCRAKKGMEFAFQDEATFESCGPEGTRVRRRLARVDGIIEVSAEKIRQDLFKIRVNIRNNTPMDGSEPRDEALMHSLVSTHVILGVESGEFVSLLEPPEELGEIAAECQNTGAWPVLVGDAGYRDTMLASPIILYDYPQIAPESAGDLFDGTEIDEILSLRIMTLTDEEKREIRASDDRARQILERTENMPAEQFMKLHGTVRGMRPLKEDIR